MTLQSLNSFGSDVLFKVSIDVDSILKTLSFLDNYNKDRVFAAQSYEKRTIIN